MASTRTTNSTGGQNDLAGDHQDHDGQNAGGPSTTTAMMLHCLFAVVFAAGTLGLLNCLGIAMRSSSCCSGGDDYSACEIWRDVRSVLSFVLGALLCCLLTREGQNNNANTDGCGRFQLYTCML
mmetsp:Transcript_133474/g.266323  ORF Transcript_133474/g.266323 Transcript_133474/m.266323 type:complete len:124 (-) Transcript_133474:143-514(-)